MEDIRPTAKWANRMLRPLTSIYRRLEKHQENLSMIASSKSKERLERCDFDSTRPSKGAGAEDGGTYSDGDDADPAWVPGKPVHRRVRHKYSTRAERNGGPRRNRVSIRSPELHKTLLPGAIEIATPLITGKPREPLGRLSAQKQQFRVPGVIPGAGSGRRGPRAKNFPAYQGSWKEVVDMSGDTEFVAIAHLLDRIFLNFLNNTRSQILPWEQTRGTRSLLSMAVRRLPEFIEEEQRIQDDLEEDRDVDMCDAYFYELEAHYAPGRSGWQPLREAVRAQGIHLVSEMLQRRCVTKLAACRLLKECMDHFEFDAFELLSSKYLSTIDSYEYPTAFDPPRSPGHCDDAIHILGTYYSRSCGRRSFVFDEMAKLLLRRVVPPEWMVTTTWKKCVDGAITSLSAEDANSTAARHLIEAVVFAAGDTYPAVETVAVQRKRLGLSHPLQMKATRASTTHAPGNGEDQAACPIPIQDALSNLTLSLVAALCAMHIARSHNPAAEQQAVGMKMREFVQSLAFTVQREVEVRPPPTSADMPMLQFLRRGYVLLGQFLLQCGGDDTDGVRWSDSVSRQNVGLFFLALASREDVIKELASLVRQVFRCYEHVHKSCQPRASPEVRQKIFQLLQLADGQGLSTLLGRVAAETAMNLAEATGDPDDHVWAVEVQEKAVSSQHGHDTRLEAPHRRTGNNSGSGLYRWEESIGEWIASTPMWKLKAAEAELASKNVDAHSSPPSTIADSMGSASPRLSPSGGSASSITSSAPSVSIKRSRTRSVSGSRSSKRRCASPVEEYSDYESESVNDAESLSSHQTCELVSATPAASRRTSRGTAREPVQTRGIARKSMDQPATSIEVVIANHNGSTESNDSAGPSHATSIHRTTRSGTSRLPASSRTRPKRPGRRASAVAPRVSQTRAVIPCSQDDGSDDELSFF